MRRLSRALGFAFVVLGASIVAAAPQGKLTTLSPWIAVKAPECAPLFPSSGGTSGGTKANLWEKAKQPALSEHCQLLQEAVERYRQGRYLDAVKFANTSNELTPGQAGPWVIIGSAYARWGKDGDAIAAFEKAKSIHPRALDDAEALDDYGAVLVRVGRLDDARKVYRALLPRVSGPQGLCGIQPQCEAAGLAYLTAGVLAMAAGQDGLEEASAILREARAKSAEKLDVRRVASLALALALDRRGDVDQAREIATEVVKTRGVPSELPSEILVRFPRPEEGAAMRAMGYELAEPASAIEAWKAFLANGGDKGVWAAHAKAHLAKLEKGEAKPKPKGKAP